MHLSHRREVQPRLLRMLARRAVLAAVRHRRAEVRQPIPDALEQPDWKQKAEWKTQAGRGRDRAEITAAIGAIIRKKPIAHWMEVFEEAGVPCGPIYTIDQVFADPQVKHLGIAQSTPKKDGSPLNVVGQPFTLSRTNSSIAVRPPELGEHTDEVLKEFGFSAGEIDALRKAKAV